MWCMLYAQAYKLDNLLEEIAENKLFNEVVSGDC